MKIYSFWSGDTTYYTKSKSLKKAQAVGKENMKHYLETCKYLGEEPEVDETYFIPQKGDIYEETAEWLQHMIDTDPDTVILDDEIYSLL